MVDFAHALSALGLDVVTFNFLYTEQGRRIPDRAPALEACYRAVIEAVRAQRRRARGARCSSAASRWADASRRRSPPPIRRCPSPGSCCSATRCIRRDGRPSGATSICRRSRRPMLFVQGSRDAFGTPDELAPILGTLQPRADAARRRAGRPFVQAVEEGSRGAGRGLRRACSGRSSRFMRDSFSSDRPSPPCEKPWRR